MTFGVLIAAAIALHGVTGENLRARAFFDANNVLVGDPLVLTVDFFGNADFASLHPPALSRYVDRTRWKVDDQSAKTDTFEDGRRLTYRVRPMSAGVLWLPELEFTYLRTDGSTQVVRSNKIPVHARKGRSVAVESLSRAAAFSEMPSPPELVTELSEKVSSDMEFDWRKACASPSEDAFRQFDFPEARMNEARCAILAGRWAEALRIYSSLEWRLGQTPAIERGIVSAIALRDDDPQAELPVWRQVGRPILRFAWIGRIGISLGVILAVALVFWLVGRGIRAIACLSLALLLPHFASADLFEEMNARMDQFHQAMRQMGGGFNISFGGAEDDVASGIAASLTVDSALIQSGTPFNFILSLDAPRDCELRITKVDVTEGFGLTAEGNIVPLEDGVSFNPTNVVKRFAIPVRYDVPLETDISLDVSGMATVQRRGFGGRSVFRSSRSFSRRTNPYHLKVAPLPSDGQPSDFSGIVSTGLLVSEECDRLKVGTNDVITITWRLVASGFVPPDYVIPGAAFEWSRSKSQSTDKIEVVYRGYYVADGSSSSTPPVKISDYDPRMKKYRQVKTGSTPFSFVAVEEGSDQ